jgi:hypothetical protein
MKALMFAALLGLSACSSTHDIKASGGTTNTVGGTTTLTITLGIIDQINKLCTDQLATTIFNNKAEHDKAVADCVLNHLNATIPGSAAATYGSQFCGANVTPQTAATCTALGL